MQEFTRIPATKMSLSKRKAICGVGVNDADYITQPTINGKIVSCPAYRAWRNMVERCYSEKLHDKNPTYKGCSVCVEWLTFSNFARWFEEYSVEGWDLDKDIVIKGNKEYSPSACVFIPHCVNSLLLSGDLSTSGMLAGVDFMKESGKFRSRISIDSRFVHIGMYGSQREANAAYLSRKNEEINRKIKQFPQLAIYLNKFICEA